MGLSFANPAAAWMLLGLPAVLAIHFLQSRNRPREISTLFLLELLPEESKRGAVFTYLRNSLQLWMQLLSVLLLALLLAQPRWTRSESVQSVAVVLDDTAHMRSFQEEALRSLRAELRRLSGAAARNEWLIASSDAATPPFYRGESLSGALDALADWRPSRLRHDPASALTRARERIGPDGLLLFVTAHPPEAAPAGAQVLGVGRPLENSGFTGVQVRELADGRLEWTASLAHFGDTPVERELRVELTDGSTSPVQRVALAPDSLTTLRGTLPAGSRRGILRLNPDDYGLDDVFPFLLPQPKNVRVRIPADESWGQRVMGLLPGVVAVEENAALHWERIGEGDPPPDRSGIFVYAGDKEGEFGEILAEDHPLVRDLNWNAFLGRPMAKFRLRAGDQTLVWMGANPLVVLREIGNVRQLILGFNPARGNGERLPAVILTLHRFAERIREQQPGFEAVALETHQRIRLALPGAGDLRLHFQPVDGPSREWTARAASLLLAPDAPGFLAIHQDETLLLEASVAMADTSIADLRGASSRPLPGNLLAELQERNSRRDALTPLWFALFGLALFVGWFKPQ